MDLQKIEERKQPELHTEFDIKEKGSSTVNSKKEKKYNYYICDYCNEKVRLSKKDAEGGTIEFAIKNRTLKLALHNKCLNASLKEINKKYEGE